MLQHIITAIWFMLPAAIANATPIFLARIPLVKKMDAPLDLGNTIKGDTIFGSNKTWRGLVGGMIIATLIFGIQHYLVAHTAWASDATGEIDYAELNVWLIGPLLGLGALGGDAIESFFKRRRNIQPGKAWFPFDQSDYILGAVLITLPFVQLDIITYVWIFVIWFGAHLLASYIGWLIGVKNKPI